MRMKKKDYKKIKDIESLKNISASDLNDLMQTDDAPVLIDVREDWEKEMFDIGGACIPLGSIMERLDEIPTDKPVVLYCEKGIRSAIAIQRLTARDGFTNLINLEGGMKTWKANFDL